MTLPRWGFLLSEFI